MKVYLIEEYCFSFYVKSGFIKAKNKEEAIEKLITIRNLSQSDLDDFNISEIKEII